MACAPGVFESVIPSGDEASDSVSAADRCRRPISTVRRRLALTRTPGLL